MVVVRFLALAAPQERRGVVGSTSDCRVQSNTRHDRLPGRSMIERISGCGRPNHGLLSVFAYHPFDCCDSWVPTPIRTTSSVFLVSQRSVENPRYCETPDPRTVQSRPPPTSGFGDAWFVGQPPPSMFGLVCYCRCCCPSGCGCGRDFSVRYRDGPRRRPPPCCL